MLSSFYLKSSSSRAPLRIGLMLDSTSLPRCFAQVVEDIQNSNFASIQLIVLHQQPIADAPEPPASLPVRTWRMLRDPKRRKALAYWWYTKFDQRRHPLKPDPLEPVECGKLFEGVPQILVVPISKGFTHRFSPEAIEGIRSHDIDVFFRFGFNILRGDVLKSARYGVWSFHHGDNDHYRGGPPHFWEIVEDSPLSGVILQVLTEELDAGHVLSKQLFSSVAGISLQLNRFGPFQGSTHMAIRKLRELHEHGWDYLVQRSVPSRPYQGKRKIYRTPTNLEVVKWLAPKLASKALERPLRKNRVPHWRIAVRAKGPALHKAASEGAIHADLSGFHWMESPPGRFWADPFLIEHAGQTWLFFEDFSYAERRGIISVAPLLEDGGLGDVRAALDLPYHLSFPNVFQHGGEVFMIPESAVQGTVELHRATRFPYEWKLEKVLMRGMIVDVCPWFDGQRWWFFAAMGEPDGQIALSMLFSAGCLTGEWSLHPASPISSDVLTARNAGAIFSSGGQLFRPSQNCAGEYGRSVTLNAIAALTPEDYSERPVLTMEPHPSWGFSGTHTYNFSGRFETIDAVKYEPGRNHLS